MKVLIKEPKKEAAVIDIKNDLKTFQWLVRGLIEVIHLEGDLFIVCNEEGKLLNMERNLQFDYDYIAGPLFIVAEDRKSEDGSFKGLTKEQIKKAKELIKDRGV